MIKFLRSYPGISAKFLASLAFYLASVIMFIIAFTFDWEVKTLIFWGVLILFWRSEFDASMLDIARRAEFFKAISQKLQYALDQADMAPEFRTIWKHNKRGSRYIIDGLARFQCSTTDVNDGDMLYVYRNIANGELSVRHPDEFTDGRFAVELSPVYRAWVYNDAQDSLDELKMSKGTKGLN